MVLFEQPVVFVFDLFASFLAVVTPLQVRCYGTVGSYEPFPVGACETMRIPAVSVAQQCKQKEVFAFVVARLVVESLRRV